jgi:hypothetical protein
MTQKAPQRRSLSFEEAVLEGATLNPSKCTQSAPIRRRGWTSCEDAVGHGRCSRGSVGLLSTVMFPHQQAPARPVVVQSDSSRANTNAKVTVKMKACHDYDEPVEKKRKQYYTSIPPAVLHVQLKHFGAAFDEEATSDKKETTSPNQFDHAFTPAAKQNWDSNVLHLLVKRAPGWRVSKPTFKAFYELMTPPALRGKQLPTWNLARNRSNKFMMDCKWNDLEDIIVSGSKYTSMLDMARNGIQRIIAAQASIEASRKRSMNATLIASSTSPEVELGNTPRVTPVKYEDDSMGSKKTQISPQRGLLQPSPLGVRATLGLDPRSGTRVSLLSMGAYCVETTDGTVVMELYPSTWSAIESLDGTVTWTLTDSGHLCANIRIAPKLNIQVWVNTMLPQGQNSQSYVFQVYYGEEIDMVGVVSVPVGTMLPGILNTPQLLELCTSNSVVTVNTFNPDGSTRTRGIVLPVISQLKASAHHRLIKASSKPVIAALPSANASTQPIITTESTAAATTSPGAGSAIITQHITESGVAASRSQSDALQQQYLTSIAHRRALEDKIKAEDILIQQAQERLDNAIGAKGAIAEEVTRISANCATQASQKAVCERENGNLASQITDLQRTTARLKDEVSQAKQHQETLPQRIASIQQEFQQNQHVFQELDTKNKALTKKLKNAVKALCSKIQAFRGTVDETICACCKRDESKALTNEEIDSDGWAQCDLCKRWYHTACVPNMDGAPSEEEQWLCAECPSLDHLLNVYQFPEFQLDFIPRQPQVQAQVDDAGGVDEEQNE